MEEGLIPVQSQISCILDAFTLSCGKLNLDSESAQDLILNHQGLKAFEKTTLISQLIVIASMLTDFASKLLLFTSLSSEDQKILLKHNIPFYLQYIMARYFSADTGLDQLNWILEGPITFDSLDQVSSFQKLNFEEYNQFVKLCETSELAEFYQQCSENIGIFYPFPQYCNGLVANMLLFYTDESMREELNEANRIFHIFQACTDLMRKSHKLMDRSLQGPNSSDPLKPLIYTLKKMNSIFGSFVLHQNSVFIGRPVPKALPLVFTQAEENWVNLRFQQFQDQFKSIVPTKVYLDTVANLLCHNTPVTAEHMQNWRLMVSERSIRVLKVHPEFESLSTREQEALWNRNKGQCITLAGMRLAALQTGKGQFMNEIGIIDTNNAEWESDFIDIYNLNSMQSHYISESELNLGKLEPKSLTFFATTVKELSEICFNDQIYQLITLITLLDTEGLEYSQSVDAVIKLRKIYLKIYQRKLTAAVCSYADYANFRALLNKVKILSDFMQKIVGN